MKNSTIEKLDLLNGCEVNSLKHEGIVLVKGLKGYVNGNVIELTEKTINYLFKRYIKSELGLQNYF